MGNWLLKTIGSNWQGWFHERYPVHLQLRLGGPYCMRGEHQAYLPKWKLDRDQVLRLVSCSDLHEVHNVIILGAGQGMAASRSFYSVRYIHLPDILVGISLVRTNGTYRDYMRKQKKEWLLILDEWQLLYPLKEVEAKDMLGLVEVRNKVTSTIFCSQFGTGE